MHIRLCTRGKKERELEERGGDNKRWEERKLKRGEKKEKKRSERNFFSSQFYFIEVPFGLTLTSSDHFYWHQAMNLKLRQWGTFSSLPGFANLLHDEFLLHRPNILTHCSRMLSPCLVVIVNIFCKVLNIPSFLGYVN